MRGRPTFIYAASVIQPYSLSILTLNLHCYQESNQLEKFHLIAEEIVNRNIDVICFQEAAQHRESATVGNQLKADNASLIIQELVLKMSGKQLDLIWDWSHYGWDVWEEGLAILSRFPIRNHDSMYVTESHLKTDWLSRIALKAEIELPNENKLRITNTHLGWFDDPTESYLQQISSLKQFSEDSDLVVGDFNIAAGTTEYDSLKQHLKLIDTYVEVKPKGMFDPTIGGDIDGWQQRGTSGMRIDYIWMNPDANFHPVSAEILFYQNEDWLVSDHAGVLLRIDF